MVFFTCNSCGQSVKKAHVEKHYLTECRNCEVLSCIDCGKDFVGDDYKHHTKCVSENEKYGGKDYRATTKPNKGEVKQSQWIECVQAASSAQSVDPRVRGLLNRLADYSNIPRKKAKFEKFIQNSLKVWNPSLIEQTWAVFSKASDKQKTQTEKSTDEAGQQEMCPEKDSEVGPSKKKGDETGAVMDGLLQVKETKHHTDGLLPVSKKKKKEDEPDKLITKSTVANGGDGAVHISKKKIKSKHTDGSTNDSEAHEKLDKKTKHKHKQVQLEESDPAQPAKKKKKKVKKHEDEPDKLMTKSTVANGAVHISKNEKKKKLKHTDGSTNGSEAHEKLDKKTKHKHKHKHVQLEESDPAQPAKKKKKVKKHEDEPDKLMTKSLVENGAVHISKNEKKKKSKHTDGSEAHEKLDKTKHKHVQLEESDRTQPAKKKKKKAKVGQ